MAVASLWAGCSGSGDDDDTYSAAGTGGTARPANTGGTANTATGGRTNTATGGRRNTTNTGGTTPVTGNCPGSQPEDGTGCSLDAGETCFYGNGAVTCACNSYEWECTNRTGATGGRSNGTGGAGDETGGGSAETGGTAEGGGGPGAGAPPEIGGSPAEECPAEQPDRRDRCSGTQTCSYDGVDCTCTDDRWRCAETTGTGGTEPGTGGTTQTEGGAEQTGGTTQTEGGAEQTGGTTQTEGGASPEGGSTGTGGTTEVVCPAEAWRDGVDCDPQLGWCDYPDQDPTLTCYCGNDGWQCHTPGETAAECPAQPPRDGNSCDPDLPWCDYADPAFTCYCDSENGWRCI